MSMPRINELFINALDRATREAEALGNAFDRMGICHMHFCGIRFSDGYRRHRVLFSPITAPSQLVTVCHSCRQKVKNGLFGECFKLIDDESFSFLRVE